MSANAKKTQKNKSSTMTDKWLDLFTDQREQLKHFGLNTMSLVYVKINHDKSKMQTSFL